MLATFRAVCIGGLCGLSITAQRKPGSPPAYSPLPTPHWGPLPSAPLPVPSPPVKRMTKDLSYAGSKNQNFLLAFSFVASRVPPPPPLPPGPRLEAIPSLKLLF